MEQLSNAKAISMLSLGHVMNRLDKGAVQGFLKSPPSTPVNYPCSAEIIADIIDSKSWSDLKAAWANVNIAF
jgi:hypothetical protein